MDVELRIYPPEDSAFETDVLAAITHSRATLNEGYRLLEAVRRDLRLRYPQVEIHPRESIAVVGEDRPMWYVFRDGQVTG